MTDEARFRTGFSAIVRVTALLIVVGIGHLSLKGDDTAKAQLPPASELLAIPGVKARLEGYLKNRSDQINNLIAKYHSALDTRINAAANVGNIELTTAFQREKQRVNTLQESLGKPNGGPVDATIDVAVALDFLPEKSPDGLVGLRKMWTAQDGKIRGKLAGDLQEWIKTLEVKLTKSRDFENARRLLAFRKAFVVSVPRVSAVSADKVVKPPKVLKGVWAATKDKPYENSLDMKFVPVPITGGPSDGKTVLFSIWETRMEDYEKFIKRNRKVEWPKAIFPQKDDHPAVMVLWEDAVAFAVWLTGEDRKKGKLGRNELYRLPTDHEWSCAVGIGKQENAEMKPSAKSSGIKGIYPWGMGWPPPKGAGNYYGEETKKNPTEDRVPIEGYDDGFDRTAPVGSFGANKYGLYDIGGNVWEYCEDWYSTAKEERVMRGGSWYYSTETLLLSSFRSRNVPSRRVGIIGFRLVLVGADG